MVPMAWSRGEEAEAEGKMSGRDRHLGHYTPNPTSHSSESSLEQQLIFIQRSSISGGGK